MTRESARQIVMTVYVLLLVKDIPMSKRILVLYGTESGNAQYCAEILGDELEKSGLNHDVVDMSNYNPEELLNEAMLIIITSTHGNGDAPANAEGMLDYLQTTEMDLSHLKFAVCALGDSSFFYFAQCGKDFDEILGKRKGQRLMDRVDCDADFDDEYDVFLEKIVAYLQSQAS